MAKRTPLPCVRHVSGITAIALLLLAPAAFGDDVGGESVEIPPPATAMDPADPLAAEVPVAKASGWTPVQVSVVPPVQIFQDPARVVHGLRLNVPYGEWGTVNGLDLGIGNILNGDLRGVQVGFANVVEGSARGAQIGVVNWSGQHLSGLQLGFLNVIEGEGRAAQIGFANQSGSHRGLQLGFANISQSLRGVQIGVANVILDGKPVPFLPVINVGF